MTSRRDVADAVVVANARKSKNKLKSCLRCSHRGPSTESEYYAYCTETGITFKHKDNERFWYQSAAYIVCDYYQDENHYKPFTRLG